jgi:hypothetical protein
MPPRDTDKLVLNAATPDRWQALQESLPWLAVDPLGVHKEWRPGNPSWATMFAI